MDPANIEEVVYWEVPRTPSEIKRFCGLAGYYRRFILEFSKIVVPLTRLMKKNVYFYWGPEKQEAYENLGHKLCKTPILTLVEGTDGFLVFVMRQLLVWVQFLCRVVI